MTDGKELGAAVEGASSLGRDVPLVPGLRHPRLSGDGDARGSPGALAEGEWRTLGLKLPEPLLLWELPAPPGPRAWRTALPLVAGCPSRPGPELQRGAGFQADGAKGSLDQLELPLANWDGIPAKLPAIPATLAALPPGLL